VRLPIQVSERESRDETRRNELIDVVGIKVLDCEGQFLFLLWRGKWPPTCYFRSRERRLHDESPNPECRDLRWSRCEGSCTACWINCRCFLQRLGAVERNHLAAAGTVPLPNLELFAGLQNHVSYLVKLL
jgi:hypothetical protein